MNMAPVLEVDGLSVQYRSARGFGRQVVFTAVHDVSLRLEEGETLSLVGESGCGKTTTGQAIFQLIPSIAGTVRFMGQDITGFSRARMRPLRQKMQVVYQDPFGALNPRMTAAELIAEPLMIHERLSQREMRSRAAELLETVSLSGEFLDRYPHEFSGGQRQRLAIARALSVRPKLLLCDEPVSALDVSVQAQILNLFLDLKERYRLSYLFVSHELAVVRHMSDRVAVMYLGRIVETARRDDLYSAPRHPYTQALLGAVTVPDPEVERARPYTPPQGEVPSAFNPPSGCPFHPRCPRAMDRCSSERPQSRLVSPQHLVACHLYEI